MDALESSQCLAVDPEDGTTLTELNLGLVAAFYYIRYTTIGKSIISDFQLPTLLTFNSSNFKLPTFFCRVDESLRDCVDKT